MSELVAAIPLQALSRRSSGDAGSAVGAERADYVVRRGRVRILYGDFDLAQGCSAFRPVPVTPLPAYRRTSYKSCENCLSSSVGTT